MSFEPIDIDDDKPIPPPGPLEKIVILFVLAAVVWPCTWWALETLREPFVRWMVALP